MPYYLSEDDLRAARREFEKAGLEIVAGGNISLVSDDSSELEHYFKYAVAAGMPIMVCAPTHSNLAQIEKLAIKYDRKMAIHNHGPEDRFYPAPSDVMKRVKDMDPRMGLCVDVGHAVRTGADILEEIDGAWDRIYDFHVKDLTDFSSKESRVDVGDGKMPIAAIFKMLKKRNYSGSWVSSTRWSPTTRNWAWRSRSRTCAAYWTARLRRFPLQSHRHGFAETMNRAGMRYAALVALLPLPPERAAMND